MTAGESRVGIHAVGGGELREARDVKQAASVRQARDVRQPAYAEQARNVNQPAYVGQLRSVDRPAHVGQVRSVNQPAHVGQVRNVTRPANVRQARNPNPNPGDGPSRGPRAAGDARVARRVAAVSVWVSLVLVGVLGLSRALVGLFGVDVVAIVFGVMTPAARVVYALLGAAAVYCAIVTALSRPYRRAGR